MNIKDPTDNVREMIATAIAASDSLRQLEQLRVIELLKAEQHRVNDNIEAERRRINESMAVRADFNAQLAVAEAKRIDAIRAVDVNAVSVASERANAQAAVLATQVASSAEALRALVAATAATQATQLGTLTTQLTDRLTALEKSQYESKGSGSGKSDMYGWVFGALMMLISVVSVVFNVMHH